MKYQYVVHVDETETGAVAYLDEAWSPLSATGATPLEAVAALNEAIMAWRHGPSRQWLEGTPQGRDLQRLFIDDPTQPNRGRPAPEGNLS